MASHSPATNLTEVEPSPVDETPASFKEGSYFPSTSSSSQSKNTTFLGLNTQTHHSAIYYLARIQKYSTYAFSAFAAAHITNTSIIPLITQSVPAAEPYLLLTRPYYQGVPFEPILIIVPVYAHVLSGLLIRLLRRNLNAKRYGDPEAQPKALGFFESKFWPVVSGTSKLGFQLIPLLAGHAFIQRVIPQNFDGGSSNVNLSYVSHAFARHPAISFAGFSLLVTIACWHMTWGWAKWLGFTPDQVTELGPERGMVRKRRWYSINGIAAGITGLWMAGSFGVVGKAGAAQGWLGRLYDEMFRSIPLAEYWL